MKTRAALLVSLALWLPAAQAFHLPEIPFCPFGGLPGWINRFVGDQQRTAPPPWFRPPPPLPSYGYAYPGAPLRGPWTPVCQQTGACAPYPYPGGQPDWRSSRYARH